MGGPLFANANRVFVQHLSSQTGFFDLNVGMASFHYLVSRARFFTISLSSLPKNGCIFCKENVYLAHLAPIFGRCARSTPALSYDCFKGGWAGHLDFSCMYLALGLPRVGVAAATA